MQRFLVLRNAHQPTEKHRLNFLVTFMLSDNRKVLVQIHKEFSDGPSSS